MTSRFMLMSILTVLCLGSAVAQDRSYSGQQTVTVKGVVVDEGGGTGYRRFCLCFRQG